MLELTKGHIGDLITVLGSQAPAGYVIYNRGDKLSSGEYRELFSWAKENELVIPIEDWKYTAGNGECFKFSELDDDGWFYTPTFKAPDGLSYCIRYTEGSQTSAVVGDLEASYQAVSNLIDSIEERSTSYIKSSNFSESGWVVYESGFARLWGRTAVGKNVGTIAFPVGLRANPFSLSLTLVDPSGNTEEGSVKLTNINANKFDYEYSTYIAPDAYFMWSALGQY